MGRRRTRTPNLRIEGLLDRIADNRISSDCNGFRLSQTLPEPPRPVKKGPCKGHLGRYRSGPSRTSWSHRGMRFTGDHHPDRHRHDGSSHCHSEDGPTGGVVHHADGVQDPIRGRRGHGRLRGSPLAKRMVTCQPSRLCSRHGEEEGSVAERARAARVAWLSRPAHAAAQPARAPASA